MTTREEFSSADELAALRRGIDDAVARLEGLIRAQQDRAAHGPCCEGCASTFYSWLRDEHVPLRLTKDAAP